MIRHILSIDPGDVHNGVAYGFVDTSGLIVHWTRDLKRVTLGRLCESADVDGIVVEEFRLYPELAREQGYSNFPTCEVIGMIAWICETRGLPMFRQGASVKKKSRRIGERINVPGSVRTLGTGRSSYRGWDFDGPTQHERDAKAHLYWWGYRNPSSVLFETDYRKQKRT